MHIKTFKTHKITTADSLLPLIDAYVPALQEESILAITSKIVSVCEQRVVGKQGKVTKEALIHNEADAYLEYEPGTLPPHGIQLTLKNGILIPSAGIDESNGNGVYILYPEDIQRSAIEVWEHLRKRDQIDHLGILITDSHTTPMRRGVMGIGLGWCGFAPLYNYIGKPDCFGEKLRVTMRNNLDALAASAVFCMGEGDEQTPFACIMHAPKIAFQDRPPTKEEAINISIPMEEDLYAPLLKNKRWKFKEKKS